MPNASSWGICAVYVTPAVHPMIEATIGKVMVDPGQAFSLGAFMIGVGGLTVSDFIINFWRGWSRRVSKGDRDAQD